MARVAGEPPILEVRGVSKSYGTGRRSRRPGGTRAALADVNLAIETGETLGIVGETGAGKSTLARLLLALDVPSTGTISYRGRVVSGRGERELRDFRRHVQIVFQDPTSSLDPRMKIHDLLAEPLRALRIEVDEGEAVRRLLAQVELPASAANRYAHQLSGGQRQRVAIARSLGPSPEVLVADEPVSALDMSVRSQIVNLLGDLVRDFDLTLVLVSHDLAVVRHLCRRVAVLFGGTLVEVGEADEVFRRPRHDHTRELLDAAPRIRARAAAPEHEATAGGTTPLLDPHRDPA